MLGGGKLRRSSGERGAEDDGGIDELSGQSDSAVLNEKKYRDSEGKTAKVGQNPT